MSGATLRISAGTMRVPLDLGGHLRIGSSPENELAVSGPGISAQHAKAGISDGKYWIEQAGSAPLLVNGKPTVGRQELQHLDVVTLGDGTSLIFEHELKPPPPPTERRSALTGAVAGEQPINAAVLSGDLGSFELSLGRSVVGRGSTVRVRIDSKQVSRLHAALTVTPTEVTIEDLGSANGTSVNGVAVEGIQQVSDGDRLAFGGLEYFLVLRRLGRS
jgi:pSer/pThr/pTyr-binding forkhead associated (FHA) protein